MQRNVLARRIRDFYGSDFHVCPVFLSGLIHLQLIISGFAVLLEGLHLTLVLKSPVADIVFVYVNNYQWVMNMIIK